MQKTLTRQQRDAIPKMVAYVLANRGRTVDELGADLAGDRPQLGLRSRRIWHTKAGLDAMVAEELRLPPSLHGPDRKSNDLRRATVREIIKMRGRGELVDWRKGRRINVFRLSDPHRRADRPAVAGAPCAPEAATDGTDAGMRRLFMSIISKSKKDNTYKFALGKTLLDYCKANAPDGASRDIPYDYLAGEFLKHYWHQRFRFRMKQDFHTKRQPVVISILEKAFGDRPPVRYEDIPNGQLKSAREQILSSVFGHSTGTGVVVSKFQETDDGGAGDSGLFYDYDDDRQVITLRPEAHSFFSRNNHLLTQALLAEWVLYLEKANHGLPLLASKIMSKERKRGPLTKYRNMFYERERACFYCLNSFNRSGMHVDHFIPFSYIYDDDAWNLVLSCAECNLKKSDLLPPIKPYFGELVVRNEEYAENMPEMRVSLLQLSARGKNTWKKEMRHHYDVCSEYGFDRWRYTRSATTPKAA